MDSTIVTATKNHEAEIVLAEPGDHGITPPRFKKDGNLGILANGYIWTTIPDEEEKTPVGYLRCVTPNSLRSGGLIAMGETPVSPHRVLELNKRLYPVGGELQYKEIKGDPEGWTDDPVTCEWSSADSKLCYRFSSKYAHIVEADIIDWKFEFFPYVFLANANGIYQAPYMQQFYKITGTYKGKKMDFLGAWDNFYGKSFTMNSYNALFFGFAVGGIRPDGRHEMGGCVKYGERSYGYFWREGEDPVVSCNVSVKDLCWEPSYLRDGTVAMVKATFCFNGREIHYEAKNGFRGWDEDSITNKTKKRGYVMTYGTWYEGDTPYQLVKSYTYGESHMAFQDTVKNAYL